MRGIKMHATLIAIENFSLSHSATTLTQSHTSSIAFQSVRLSREQQQHQRQLAASATRLAGRDAFAKVAGRAAPLSQKSQAEAEAVAMTVKLATGEARKEEEGVRRRRRRRTAHERELRLRLKVGQKLRRRPTRARVRRASFAREFN